MTRWSKSLLWVALFVMAACGSKPGDLRRIKGTITGLTGTGLVLQLNGGHDLTIAANATAFDFTDNGTWMVEGANYSVTVATPPSRPWQSCTVTNGSGTVGLDDVMSVEVDCTTNTYTVSGSVTGLTGSGLVLQLDDHRNSPQSLPVTGDTGGNASFTFPNPVESGATYAVTVGVYPTNPAQSCTVENGTGTVTGTNITNVAVSCKSPSGTVSTLAGTAGQSGSTDATGATARFRHPGGVAVDTSGNIYVADTENHTIRKISPSGVVSTLAGTAGQHGSTDGTGADARFNWPSGVAVDEAGNVYVADTLNYTIRKITPTGIVSTLAGTAGQHGSTDGTGADARFIRPNGVAVDGAGNVYVSDALTYTVRKITPAGQVSTLAGTAGEEGSIDGTGADARFKSLSDIAVDAAGYLYVTENGNVIRKITPAGVVSTLAGTSGQYGSTDATGAAARFRGPSGVAADSSGNVYVADTFNYTIRKITPTGIVSTLAGAAGQYGSTDATGIYARFNQPNGVAVDGSGNIYVADTSNCTIRKITP